MSVFKKRLPAEGGFTLLEILIAITLLAFITLGVVSVTENAALTKERTTQMNSNTLQIETALSRFEWDFSQIYSPLYFSTVMNVNPNRENPDGPLNPVIQQHYEQLVRRFERNEHFSSVSKEGLPIPRFHAPEKDVFEFLTSSNRRKIENTRQSHFAWVRYSLANVKSFDEENVHPDIPKGLKSFVRYFAPDDPYDDKRLDIENIEKVRSAVLLNHVEKLEFQYWDYNRKKWETTLRSVAGGENALRGIKIFLTWYDSSGHKRTLTRIFRNHWPMVIPQDPVANRPAGGNQAGGNNGGQPPEDEE